MIYMDLQCLWNWIFLEMSTLCRSFWTQMYDLFDRKISLHNSQIQSSYDFTLICIFLSIFVARKRNVFILFYFIIFTVYSPKLCKNKEKPLTERNDHVRVVWITRLESSSSSIDMRHIISSSCSVLKSSNLFTNQTKPNN